MSSDSCPMSLEKKSLQYSSYQVCLSNTRPSRPFVKLRLYYYLNYDYVILSLAVSRCMVIKERMQRKTLSASLRATIKCYY